MQFGFAERFALGGFLGRSSSWRRGRVLVPCAAAAAALHRRRGVRSARAGVAPPLFGLCRGDWLTRRFARRRGRLPPCQRVRY